MVWNTEDKEVDWDIDDLDEINLDVLEDKAEDILNELERHQSTNTMNSIRMLLNIERNLEKREWV